MLFTHVMCIIFSLHRYCHILCILLPTAAPSINTLKKGGSESEEDRRGRALDQCEREGESECERHLLVVN